MLTFCIFLWAFDNFICKLQPQAFFIVRTNQIIYHHRRQSHDYNLLYELPLIFDRQFEEVLVDFCFSCPNLVSKLEDFDAKASDTMT